MTITCSRGLLALSPVLLVTAAGAVGLAALAPRPGSGLAQPPTPDPQPASPAPAPGPEAAEPADQPPPDAAEPEAAPPPLPAGGEPAEPEAAAPRSGRDEPAPLAFKNTPVEQVVPFIVEATGKVVMPQQDILTRRITVLNDQPLPRQRALDLVFLALQQAGIGVVQTEDLIILRDIAEITRQDVPVIGPTESMLRRTDLGTVVEKVFALRHASAENVGKIIKDSLPEFAKYYVDTDSNQVVVMGNVALLQRLEHVVEALDRPSSAALGTETYRLRYADATQVADNIRELFSSQPARGGNQQQQQQQRRDAIIQMRGGGDRGERGGGSPQQQQQGAGPGAGTASLSGNIRVTANTQQNSVTVLAEPAILEQIADQVLNVWDRPLPEEAVVPRIYDLKNSDPVKVRTLLEGLFGEAAGAAAARGGNPQQGAPATGQGVGRLAGQFSFQAIPEAGRLVVVAKSPDNLAVIDKIIEGLDQPLSAGLPRVVELKHASAEDLAEQLNALLAQEGTLASIRRSESGLSQDTAMASPFAADAATQQQQQQQNQATAQNISFWWQRARPPTDTAGSSNLVAKVRIVPVWRQNAVMVMAAPEYQESVVKLIEELDKPGRQVLISAIIAEISAEDATALGLRWSNQAITPTNADNAFGIQNQFTGTQDDFIGSLFNTSVLSTNVNLNVLLQALAQKTAISILSEPRIFTGDNQEAEFFDGQDIPFVTDSQTNTVGNLVQSFDYRAVGIQLRVRPRITIRRDVDLRINLELSSVQPTQTLFGGFIVDRRETTTQVIVQDGQTVVLSGIMRSEDADVRRKVPLLGDIPLVGLLFQSTERTTRNTELIAFITPVVVENPQEADAMSVQPRERLGHMRQELDPEGRFTPPGSASNPVREMPAPLGEPVPPPAPDLQDEPPARRPREHRAEPRRPIDTPRRPGDLEPP